MENKLIEFKTAKLAKEVGFDFWCSSAYFEHECLGMAQHIPEGTVIKDTFFAPTQTLLQSWIRLTHGIAVFPTLDTNLNWGYKIVSLDPCATYEGTIVSKKSYGSDYERCLEEGLLETLSIIKNN